MAKNADGGGWCEALTRGTTLAFAFSLKFFFPQSTLRQFFSQHTIQIEPDCDARRDQMTPMFLLLLLVWSKYDNKNNNIFLGQIFSWLKIW